jgi:Ser/Thr protein kinase RdoA (MazF antagonist)
MKVNFPNDMDNLKTIIQQKLGREITQIVLKGKGDCNYAYYVKTEDGEKYIVKQERERKETEDQNDLVVEGNLLQKLYATNLSITVPKVIFVSENPKLYGYEYIEGDLMREVWSSLSEDERIDICHSLGRFHAEIGKNFTKEMCEVSGIDMNSSLDPHPQVGKDYKMLISDPNVPVEFNNLVKEAKKIYDSTTDKAVFQFIHNDGHHENVIIKDKKISGVIDFGDSEYGETAKEFSRYIRDYPDYFQYIVSMYEQVSGNMLSYERLVSNALVSGFIDIVQNYWKGGEDRVKAEEAIAKYKRLIHKK